jgi:hypothetical protein
MGSKTNYDTKKHCQRIGISHVALHVHACRTIKLMWPQTNFSAFDFACVDRIYHTKVKIEILVVRTGQRANAKVIYVDPDPPRVCGIALEKPENIWGGNRSTGRLVRRKTVMNVRVGSPIRSRNFIDHSDSRTKQNPNQHAEIAKHVASYRRVCSLSPFLD